MQYVYRNTAYEIHKIIFITYRCSQHWENIRFGHCILVKMWTHGEIQKTTLRKIRGQEIMACEETPTGLRARKERPAEIKAYQLPRLPNGLSHLLFSGDRRASDGLCCSKKVSG